MNTLNKKKLLTLTILFLISHSILSAYANSITTNLGFDPHLSTIPLASETTKTPVITVLGFPDPEKMYQGKFDTDTTFTVTFRFHNTCLWSYLHEQNFNPLDYIKAFASINLGQEPDATVLLWAIVECYRKGHLKAHIFGNSRGGATIIKLLDMLSNPHNHPAAWATVGITNPTERHALKNMLAAGTIYLAHPLMNYQTGIKLTAARTIQPLVQFTQWSLSAAGSCGAFVARTCNATLLASMGFVLYRFLQMLLTNANNYSTRSINPITLLEQNISDENWPYHITIALAEQDKFVGKKHEVLLYDLAQENPQKLSITTGGPDHFTIRSCVKQFHTTIRNLASVNNAPSS
jgi:hypothetical protein